MSPRAPKPQKPLSKNQPNKRETRRQKRQRQRIRTTQVPVAIGSQANTYASVKTHPDGSATLHVREIFPITQTTKGLALAIPVCPTKWVGTRTASLASTYMSHRPLRVQWRYIPAAPSTLAGNIAFGTVWSGCRLTTSDDVQSLYQHLTAICSVWQPCGNGISCGRNLRANQFPLYEVNSDDIPFWIVVASDGETNVGSLMISADFTLRNPITPGTTPPASYSGPVQFTQGENETTFSLPLSSLGSPVAVGQEFQFTPLSALQSRTAETMTSPLSVFMASIKTIVDSVITFTVDPAFATQTFRSVLIGRSANFM